MKREDKSVGAFFYKSDVSRNDVEPFIYSLEEMQ